MDVPEDIRETARKIAETVRTYRHNASQWEMVRDAAAQALLAERLAQRERDAKIAEEESAKWKGCGNAMGGGYGDGARNATLKLAAAIRQS